jgi:hypothetical protein
MKDYVKAFKRKNKDTFVKSGRVMARIKVKNRKLKDFVNSLLEDEYVVERTKKVKVEVD